MQYMKGFLNILGSVEHEEGSVVPVTHPSPIYHPWVTVETRYLPHDRCDC